MFQNLENEIVDKCSRLYFGTCSCCGCLFGIEFLADNTIIYRCFGDKNKQKPCIYYKEKVEMDENGRCKNHADCILKKSDISEFQFDEVSYIINLIHKHKKFIISVTNMSLTLRNLLDKMEKDTKYSIFYEKIQDIFCFIFQKK